jgi:sulfonate transport system substrate-binding protein
MLINILRKGAGGHPQRPGVGLLLVLALVLGGLAACSSDDGGEAGATDDSTPVTQAPTTLGTVPAGTTLRFADQLEQTQLVLAAGGEDQPDDYEIEYSDFLGGPAMLQAFQAGEIDLGVIGSTPLIFAQAGGQDLVAVAGWSTEVSPYSLVVPEDSDIESWEDLEGRSVGFQRGTAAQSAALDGLDSAGLTQDDVEVVDLVITQLSTTLASGDIDAAILVDPLTLTFLADNPDFHSVERLEGPAHSSSFFIATREAVEDPGKAAAIADYIARFTRARVSPRNTETIAEAIFGNQFGLTVEQALEYQDTIGDTRIIELPGEVLEQQQHIADLYYSVGEIPEELDVADEFDDRFNSLQLAIQDEALAEGDAEEAP